MSIQSDVYWNFLLKLKERLIIITEYNVYNKIDITDRDEDLLFDLYQIHDSNELLLNIKPEE